jgi:predicted MPP superfamily phosphohydrolase
MHGTLVPDADLATLAVEHGLTLCSTDGDFARFRRLRWLNPITGFTLLHISDLHADISEGPMPRLIELLPGISYDVCVLTGDYRGATYGPFEAALESLGRVSERLKGPVYGVLGNHDTIRMVPELEEKGIRVLLNEGETISRGDEAIYLAGIDDAHFYRVDNIEKATLNIPDGAFLSCFRIHPKSIAKPHMPASMYSSAAILTVVRSVCPVPSQSRLGRCCPGIWAQDDGTTVR